MLFIFKLEPAAAADKLENEAKKRGEPYRLYENVNIC